MKNQITILTLFIVLCISSLQAQVTEEWVARYNGPGNGSVANALAVDGFGNVYVTGSSNGIGTNSDYATIKYNSNGDTLWVRRYVGPNGYDAAFAIGVDGSGNVYVTGAISSGFYFDYATIKYNSSGAQQWVQIYNSPGNSTDSPTSMVVDASGNCYVTGYSGESPNTDYATIKYNSSGDSLWVSRFDEPLNHADRATSIAIDNSGNCFVTGIINYGAATQYATLKYNSSGTQQWVQYYVGPGNFRDVPTDIAVDGLGNIYVTGYGQTNGPPYYYGTIKYNPNGDPQWANTYNVGSFDKANSISVDGSGNVYIAGSDLGHYATLKYNSNGDYQWVRRYDGGSGGYNEGKSIVLDGSGNAYVTGISTGNGATEDYATIKYNSSGDSLWVQRYNGTGNGSDDARSIAVDGSGNVYVTGGSTGSGTFVSYATIKYSQLTGIQHISSEIPNEYSLSQNYPNPFNPITVIRYSLIENRFVKLNVYDVLGNLVATLVNEKQNAGSYAVDFEGSNLSSGIYFYKLQTDNFSEVKRMTLIK